MPNYEIINNFYHGQLKIYKIENNNFVKRTNIVILCKSFQKDLVSSRKLLSNKLKCQLDFKNNSYYNVLFTNMIFKTVLGPTYCTLWVQNDPMVLYLLCGNKIEENILISLLSDKKSIFIIHKPEFFFSIWCTFLVLLRLSLFEMD